VSLSAPVTKDIGLGTKLAYGVGSIAYGAKVSWAPCSSTTTSFLRPVSSFKFTMSFCWRRPTTRFASKTLQQHCTREGFAALFPHAPQTGLVDVGVGRNWAELK
jgi:hypothetical protein